MKQHSISFLLENELITIDFEKDHGIRPDMSLLHYLRHLHHTSVKEGCGEGDCGACTIVVASLRNGKLQYKAMNSCLVLLPMIHGCQIITAEHLSEKKDEALLLHPVQEALVDHHGSQCGYCTPGIVMSLFSLWKETKIPSVELIKNRLSGNLCRCTGYQPIIDAFIGLSNLPRKDKFSEKLEETIAQLRKINTGDDIEILKTDIQYLKPFSLQSALNYRKAQPDALIIGGATDIAVALNKHKLIINKCLDISAVEELRNISVEYGGLRLGSGIPMADLGEACKDFLPALHEMIQLFGSHQIRNLATPGGNIGGASPIGDLPPILMAAISEVELSNLTSKRKMLLEEFITGYHSTLLKDDELITAIIIPSPSENKIRSYKISKRKDVDISTVSAGFSIKMNKEGIIQTIDLFYGGMAATTKRAAQAESFLVGKKWSKEMAREAALIIRKEFEPLSDARSGAEARRIMAGNLIIKFWEDTTTKIDV